MPPVATWSTAVQPLRTERFPVASARDLLGVCRALWLAAEPGSERRRVLTSIGLDLVLAIENARRMPFPNSPQQASAWFVGERAVRALGELTAGDEPALRVVVEAVARKVVGGR
jgi:hypothetical protein